MMKQFGNAPFLREPSLSTNPLSLSNFFIHHSFLEFQKQETHSKFKGEETMSHSATHEATHVPSLLY